MRNRWVMGFFFIFLLGSYASTAFSVEFSDWENAGKAFKRFGKESEIKNANEWLQSASGQILQSRYQEKGGAAGETLKEKLRMAWEAATKDETRSYAMAKFKIEDRWHGYESIRLTYSNLDFKEQFFAIRFDMARDDFGLDSVLARYGKTNLEVIERDGKIFYRYTIPYGDHLKNTPWETIQSRVESAEDEIWVEFELQSDQRSVKSVDLLAVKASPVMVPFMVPPILH